MYFQHNNGSSQKVVYEKIMGGAFIPRSSWQWASGSVIFGCRRQKPHFAYVLPAPQPITLPTHCQAAFAAYTLIHQNLWRAIIIASGVSSHLEPHASHKSPAKRAQGCSACWGVPQSPGEQQRNETVSFQHPLLSFGDDFFNVRFFGLVHMLTMIGYFIVLFHQKIKRFLIMS